MGRLLLDRELPIKLSALAGEHKLAFRPLRFPGVWYLPNARAAGALARLLPPDPAFDAGYPFDIQGIDCLLPEIGDNIATDRVEDMHGPMAIDELIIPQRIGGRVRHIISGRGTSSLRTELHLIGWHGQDYTQRVAHTPMPPLSLNLGDLTRIDSSQIAARDAFFVRSRELVLNRSPLLSEVQLVLWQTEGQQYLPTTAPSH